MDMVKGQHDADAQYSKTVLERDPTQKMFWKEDRLVHSAEAG